MLPKIISWIFGIGAMVSLFCLYQQTNRKKLIISKLCADICWVFHYMFLGAVGGIVPNFIGIFRECVFVNRENKKWASSFVWPIVFILANWFLAAFSFKSPINILPIAASSLVTVSLWLKKPRLTKLLSIPVSVSFLIYDIFVGSIIGIINESIAIISIIIYFLKEQRNNK